MARITQKQIIKKWAESIKMEQEYTYKCSMKNIWNTKRQEEIDIMKTRHEAMNLLEQYAKEHGLKEWELRRKLHPKARNTVKEL